MFPQHITLTEDEIVAFKTSMENAVDVRAMGIVANALKDRTILGMLPSKYQHALALKDIRIRPPTPSPTPTPLEPSPWSPPLPQPKSSILGTNTSPRKCFQ